MRCLAPPEPVTLEQLMQLIVAMLEHGWGTLEVSIVDHELHAVKPTPTLKTRTQIDHFTKIFLGSRFLQGAEEKEVGPSPG